LSGPSAALWEGAGALLKAMIEPERIESGTLLLCGETPETLLSQGRAAYIPTSLPLPGNVRARDSLVLSGSFLGLTKRNAAEGLAQFRLTAHANKSLQDLTRLQMRLLCLAHGFLGAPEILLLENIYADLDDAEAAIIETLLDEVLPGRAYLAIVSNADASSRSLALSCHEVLALSGNRLLAPAPPSQLVARGFYATCLSDAGPLAELLKSRGAEVTPTPHPSVLLIRNSTGRAIFQAAHEIKVGIVELTPS
jgi:ABC-type multidrug transport system ATPase subunit